MYLPFILASASPNRVDLLSRIGIVPDQIIPADINEIEYPKELPREVAKRLAYEKAMKVASNVDEGYIIGADTVAAVGRRILPKALDDDMVRFCLKMLSGKRHRLYTGVTVIKKSKDLFLERHKIVQTVLKFKRLTDDEIESYVKSGEGLNKAGGYAIQGFVQGYIEYIGGSFSNVVGLPLCELRNMLISLGYNTTSTVLSSLA